MSRFISCGACHDCLAVEQTTKFERMFRHMILCPGCGNKRCPKATNCALACTDSNEPEQAGSVYGDRSTSAPPDPPR